ncbi:MAG: protocatechuate 3,4-dioxygenase [Sphingomicrobium sp.]
MLIRVKGNENESRLSRRNFAIGALATGLILPSGAKALQGRPLTAESAMGPFYPLTKPADSDADMVWLKGHSQKASGQVIEVSGRILDVKGNPIPNALVEIWQANAVGRYDHPSDPAIAPLDPHFQSFAELRSDASGAWRITTVKPGGYDSPIGHRPPHIHFDIRGRTHRNIAQLYFPEDAAGNVKDVLYKALGAEAATSVAVRDASDPHKYQWDIILMG